MLILSLYGLLHLPSVQTWAVQKAASSLSKKLHTKVSVKKVDFSFFDNLVLEGLLIEDQKKDTLLYAGKATVNINDWFFLKNKYTLQYVGLENGYINMYRTDSVWNYKFISDYFSDTSAAKGSKISIDIKKVQLANFRFNQNDKWIGKEFNIQLKKLELDVDKFDLQNKNIHIASLRIAAPSFHQFEYDGNRPKGYHTYYKPEKASAYQWNPDEWQINADLVQVLNGKFMVDKQSDRSPYKDRFDEEHIAVTNIDGNLSSLSFKKDTIAATIKLSGLEKCGLAVKNLQANMRFNPVIMEFNKLDLVTNKSHLGDYYAMRYNSFVDDMNDFLDKVTLEGSFKNSELNSDDLAFFDPRISSWKRVFNFRGQTKGLIGNLEGKEMYISSGNSLIDGSFSLKGIPDIDSMRIYLKANQLKTTFADLVDIAPSLKNNTEIKGQRLGNIIYSGTFSGYLNKFTAAGNIQTALGSVKGNLSMKLPENASPTYEGNIITLGFNLGSLIDNSQVGSISLSGNIKGSGFTPEKLNANFDGHVSSFGFRGYNFSNLTIKGNFEKNVFNGHFNMDDPNLKIKDLDGKLNLSGKDIAFNANAALEYINFKNLNLSKKDITLSGLFDLHFTGNNIDNFLGSARLTHAHLSDGARHLSLDSIELSSVMEDNRKYLTLHSNLADAELSGKFKIMELPRAFNFFLSRYYPSYIQTPSNNLSDQHFSFNIKTREVEDILSLLPGEMKGLNYSDISGDIDLEQNKLNINGNVPEFSFRNHSFNHILFSGTGDSDSLKMNISVDDIGLTDSLHLPGTKLIFTSSNDISDIHLQTTASETFTDAELNAKLQTFDDGIGLHFSPSSFILNNKKWMLEKDGVLSLRKNIIEAKDIKFTEGYQEISLTSGLSEDKQQQLIATLNKVNIEDFIPFVFTNPEIKGLLTGKAVINDPMGVPKIDFTGKSDSFYIDRTFLGNVNLASNANSETGLITFNADTKNKEYNFNIDGNYNFRDSTGSNLLVNMTGDKINLKVLEPYLGAIFSTINGTATSKLSVTNEGKKTYLTGSVTVDSGYLIVDYTKCKYLLKNQTIQFRKNEIDVSNLVLTDTLGNKGSLSGIMQHDFFRNFSFHKVRMETPRMLLLNTGKNDNDQFYGNITGRATMTLNGPLSDMKMTIDGAPSLADSSHIYIPTNDSKESKTIDYIDFVEFGSLAKQASWNNEAANIVVDMNIEANRSCKVDVILDQSTGDIIKGTGQGLINIRAGNREPLNVRGRYELSSGEYTFNFQTFFKKPFVLNRGNITWNGDPYEAIIDIDAEYLAKNVNVSSIVPTGGFKQKEDIIILSHLQGNLSKPLISFEFKLPEKSELNRDYITVKKLRDLQNDENEMNKQVASLLLFNTFLTESQNFFSGENTIAFATSTVGGIISSWLTNIFNKELEKATNGMVSTYIDINPTLTLQKNANELQANVRAGLKLLLSNRLVFLVGGNLDYNNPYVQLDRKGLITPDVTLEWLLNKEGSMRVVGFHRSSIDYTMGQRNRSGAQLSYRKDFDRIGDIFKSRKKIEEEAIKSELKEN